MTGHETSPLSTDQPRHQEGTAMHEFTVSDQPRLRVEVGPNDVDIDARETDQITVDFDADPDDEAARTLLERATIEQHGDEVVVTLPKRSGFVRRTPKIGLRITVPLGCRVDVRAESGDVTTQGRLGDASFKAGSGELRIDHAADLRAQSGSGDVTVGASDGTATVTTGSGDVMMRLVGGSARLATGSGDLRVERSEGPIQVNSGSGDVSIDSTEADVTANTASGDQHLGRVVRGRVRLNSASGDIHVGVVDGTAVWLDVNTLSGSVNSALSGGEPPTEGEDTVELKVNTVSGDIALARA